MNISTEIWKKYINGLSKVSDQAKKLILKYLENHQIETYEDRQAFIDYCYGISVKYGEAAAEFACQMYDAESAYEGVTVPPAEPAPTAKMSEVAKAVNGTLGFMLAEVTASAIGRFVKRTGQDTTLQNAIRDRVEWAWIPQGETCAFCIMLASQGWQPASSKALKNGHAEHIHANCDCMYAVRMNSQTTVEGYNPSQYKRMYYDAPLDGEAATPKNRLNAMRREFYKQNADEINEQKLEAYAKQKERESSEAEETDVE
jgi:hypothetical protein